MDRKYYTAEQILEALSEVGVGAGDISEVLSCLGRRELNNNSTEVNKENSDLIRRQDAIDAMMQLQDEDIEAYGCEIPEGFDGDRAVMALKKLPSAEPEIIYCKNCKWWGRVDKRRFYRGSDCLRDHLCSIVPDRDFCSRAERKEDE